MGHWWASGCPIGYEHTFTNAISDFLAGLTLRQKMCPDFEDALKIQYVCDAVFASAENETWRAI